MDTSTSKSARPDNHHNSRDKSDELRQDLRRLEHENQQLRMRLAELTPDTNTSEPLSRSRELQLAEFIIKNSPAILFRRLASDDPKKRKMVYVSPNFSRFGYRSEDFLTGKMMFRDILFHEDTERTLLEIQSFIKQNIETYTQIYRIVTKQGEVRWVEDQTSVIEDATTGIRYHQGIVTDIHERKVAEEELRKSEEKYRRIVETAGEGFLLMDESLQIVDLNSAFAKIVSSQRIKLIGQKPFGANSKHFQQFWTSGQHETGREYRVFECEIQSSNRRKVPVLVHANALRSDTGELIGNMAFVTDMTEHKKALSLAGEVQRSLLPEKAPLIHGLEVAGKNIQCDEVGGDYFDYLWNPNLEKSEFTVVVGDISGHGVDSALLMSSARAFLRMRAFHPGSITNIVTDMNQHMTEDVYATGRFMTLFYLTIDKNRKSIEWIRAGHDPALLYDPDLEQFEELKGPGLALGVEKEYAYQRQHRDDLRTNQLIVLGTDGIWEATSKTGEMFGKGRFQDIIRHNASKNAEEILATVFQEHADFTRGTKTEDDTTLVIVKIL